MPDILELLSGLFSPGEAEAAGPRAPSLQMQMLQNPMLQQRMQEMRLQEQAARIMLREVLRQQAAQQDPMKQLQLQQAQQRVTAGAEKAKPQPSIAELLGGGGPAAQPSAAPEDVIFRGTTPETGTPFFTNYPGGLPKWVSPEEREQFTQRFEATRAKAVLPSAPTRAPEIAAIAQHAQIVNALTKQGYAPTEASAIADMAVPSIRQRKQAEKLEAKREERETQVDIQRRVQQERFVLENQGNLFRKGTGEPFMLAPPEEIGDAEKTLKDYVALKPENAKDKRHLDGVAGYVKSFKDLLVEIQPLLSSEKRGITGRLKAGGVIEYLRAQGDHRVRKMDALAAQITLLARGFGGDSRVSDPEMARLDKSIITGWTTKEGAQSTLDVLDDFIKNRAMALGFSKYTLPGRSQTMVQPVIEAKDKSGKAIISRDNGLNWEYK